MHLEVEDLTSHHDDEVHSFLNALGGESPSVLGYHFPFYRDMLVEIGVGKPAYLGARADGKLVGYLPAFSRCSDSGTVYCSLPYFGPNAGVLCAEGPGSPDIHRALLRALLDRALQEGALSCSVYTPLMFDDFEAYDEAMPEAVVTHKVTQYLDLTTRSWSSSVRYDIRKATRLGVTIARDPTPERMDSFYSIYQQNCRDYGIPLKPRKCLDELVRDGVLGTHTDIYFAYRDETMIGGLLVVFGPLTASYYVPCSLAEARTLQPGTVLIDRAVEDARGRGIRIWNWEASPSRESGVYKFKRKWGSHEGSFRIYTQPYRSKDVFQGIGRERLAREFPWFFVYPFDQL